MTVVATKFEGMKKPCMEMNLIVHEIETQGKDQAHLPFLFFYPPNGGVG